MKVFLSHPMNGLSESEIMSIRDSAYTYLQAVYGNIKIIDNLHLYEAPKGAGRLWHLGRSILWGLGRRSRMLRRRNGSTILRFESFGVKERKYDTRRNGI